MTIRARIKKLEALPVQANIWMESIAEIALDQAEKIYNEVMNGSHPPLFIMTNRGKGPINELSEQELGQIYKEYADGNFEIITEQEV